MCGNRYLLTNKYSGNQNSSEGCIQKEEGRHSRGMEYVRLIKLLKTEEKVMGTTRKYFPGKHQDGPPQASDPQCEDTAPKKVSRAPKTDIKQSSL